MAKWVEDIIAALANLNGIAPLADIYQEVRKIRSSPHPESLTAIVRGTIEDHSSDSARYKGKDLFFSVKGLGSGVWGLRSFVTETPEASDIDEGSDNENKVADNQNLHAIGNQAPGRTLQKTYRILRDTHLACQIKLLHNHRCQLCDTSIVLVNKKSYSEAHHIKPLGRPHNGPDIANNIIVLCPNHHVMLDYGVIKLDNSKIRINIGHSISEEFIEYHNENIFGASY